MTFRRAPWNHDCHHCADSGHAGGNLDDPNACGFCEKAPVPVFTEANGDAIAELHRTGEVFLHRSQGVMRIWNADVNIAHHCRPCEGEADDPESCSWCIERIQGAPE